MRHPILACALLLGGCTADNGVAPSGRDSDGGTSVRDFGDADRSAVAPPDLAPTGDLVVIPDFTKLASGLGGQCYRDQDCIAGKTPTCFTTQLLNQNGYPKTIDGYCSSPCAVDGDCGPNGRCTGFGADGKWCLAGCSMPSQCRTGYACFVFNGGSCFPDESLDCDPTAGDGTCSIANTTGGCVRAAFGTGNTGSCRTACVIGTATCPGGPPVHCIYRDATVDTQSGKPTGDKFKGGLCAGDKPTVAVGQTCLMMNLYYPYECADGAECYFSVAKIAPNGDYVCHPLCYLPGGGPTDGGVPLPMGGVVAGPCPNGTKCTDVYQEGAEVDPARRVGFCL